MEWITKKAEIQMNQLKDHQYDSKQNNKLMQFPLTSPHPEMP